MLKCWQRRFLQALVAMMVFALSTAVFAKEEELPGFIKYSLFRQGKQAGFFAYKTVTAESGKIYTSTRIEVKVRGGGTLAIRTHIEQEPNEKVKKYKKWIGNRGARPSLIGFWRKGEFRVVSKGNKRFTRDTKPEEGFVMLDRYGFKMYADIAQRWNKSQPAQLPCVVLHKGTTATLTLEYVGIAVLKHPSGKEIQATRLKIGTEGFHLEIFVGDKPMYLGMQSKTLLSIREGYTLVELKDKAPELPADNPEATDAEATDAEATDADIETKPNPKSHSGIQEPTKTDDTEESQDGEKLPELPE